MANMSPIPEAVPYAGQVDIFLAGQHIQQRSQPRIPISRGENYYEGVASNTAPHLLRLVDDFIMPVGNAIVNYIEDPHPELQSVNREEIVNAVFEPSRTGLRVWNGLRCVIESSPDSNLIVEGDDQIRGDFGFGLAWLKINGYSTLVGHNLAHIILLKRAERLGIKTAPSEE